MVNILEAVKGAILDYGTASMETDLILKVNLLILLLGEFLSAIVKYRTGSLLHRYKSLLAMGKGQNGASFL